MQLINEARTKILLYRVWSPGNTYVQPIGCLVRPLKRLVNAACDEVERRVAFHLDGRARMVSQDEDWNVIGRVVPPPAFPVHVRPGTTNRSEHVPSENPPRHSRSPVRRSRHRSPLCRPRRQTGPAGTCAWGLPTD